MKKVFSLLLITLLFTACEGPQGPQGLNGLNGAIIASSGFEIIIDFNATNNYEFIEPYGFDVFPFDVTLVYILWESSNGQDIWRLLPQSTTFNDDTILIYNFDFTQNDVSIFLDGTTNLNTLDASWTQNQTFRVVVVPADNVGKTAVNYSDYNATIEALNISAFKRRY